MSYNECLNSFSHTLREKKEVTFIISLFFLHFLLVEYDLIILLLPSLAFRFHFCLFWRRPTFSKCPALMLFFHFKRNKLNDELVVSFTDLLIYIYIYIYIPSVRNYYSFLIFYLYFFIIYTTFFFPFHKIFLLEISISFLFISFPKNKTKKIRHIEIYWQSKY